MTSAPPEFEALFREEYPGVLALCVRVAGDRQSGEDAAQEAFARAFARWGRLRHYDRPGAWVRRVAIREAVRSARRDGRRTELEGSAGPRGGPDPSSGEVDTRVDALAALSRLSPRQRAAAILVWVDDLSIVDVARVLGCRPATVRVHLHRARLALADQLVPPESAAAGRTLAEEGS